MTGEDADGYPSFLEFIRARHGRKWCVAQRLTDQLRRAGHEVALSQKRYNALRLEWAQEHPAYLLAATLPIGHPQRGFRARRGVASTQLGRN